MTQRSTTKFLEVTLRMLDQQQLPLPRRRRARKPVLRLITGENTDAAARSLPQAQIRHPARTQAPHRSPRFLFKTPSLTN
eukprot:CAMPEP_0175162242 /NCGR_PEP_ID=MMETSP0087-20121206/25049_1 /TAXON_ID=136419 /ORGANISM="Unknown Unknown, Strain D1" /LENGTH=79 /DNA_ID=CAMNT_0016450741 /DNA_START=363 /DNA_END=602 /DNA_ORIENTATION=-